MSSTGSTRGNPAMADIVRSMVVIALIILAVYGIGRFFTESPGDPVEPIDYVEVVGQASAAADFALLAPSSLPQGWRATSARFEPNSWHLGVLTDDDEYLGLEQTRSSVDRAVDRWAEGSRVGEPVEIAGRTWTTRTGPKDRLTYVRREAGLTTLVNGTAPRDVTQAYIESLSDEPPAAP